VGEGFGERGETFRWVDDEGWVCAVWFDIGAAKGVEEAREGWVFGETKGEVVEEGDYLGEGVWGGEVGEFAVDSLFDSGYEVDSAEGGGEVDFCWF